MVQSRFSKKVQTRLEDEKARGPMPTINMGSKVGMFGQFKIARAYSAAVVDHKLKTIEAVQKEANATAVAVAESEGELIRLEHARGNAEVKAAIGNKLIENNAAAHRTIGTTRFAAGLSSIEAREEWLTTSQQVVTELKLSQEDAQALAELAHGIHGEIEQANDDVYNGVRGAVSREYNNACLTANEIINR